MMGGARYMGGRGSHTCGAEMAVFTFVEAPRGCR